MVKIVRINSGLRVVEVHIPESKKLQERYSLNGKALLDNGKVLSLNLRPKFQGRALEDYLREDMPFYELMSATEYVGDKLNDYLNDTKVLKIAEEKFDGQREGLIVGAEGNRMFSKRLSDQSGWFTENSDTVPHLRDMKTDECLYDTMFDGELVSIIEGADSNTVQTVTGSKPVKALYNQLTDVGLLEYRVFDILRYKGVPVHALSLIKRKMIAFKAYLALPDSVRGKYVTFAKMYVEERQSERVAKLIKEEAVDMLTPQQFKLFVNQFVTVKSFDKLYKEFLEQGKEGIMVKDLSRRYEFKKTDAFVKMKDTQTYDVIIMGVGEAKDDYTGKKDVWCYFKDKNGNKLNKVMSLKEASAKGMKPISKTAFFGWIPCIVVGAYSNKKKLIKVADVSGYSAEVARKLTADIKSLVGAPIEIKGQRVMDATKCTIRHPRFGKFRPDQAPKNCTIEKILEMEY